MTEVPTFRKGEPGFAGKLNQLADVVRGLQAEVDRLSKPAAKRTPKPAPKGD